MNWPPLRPHAGQRKLFHSPARFVVAACGRRSGKTEIAKRRGVLEALRQTDHSFFNVVFSAPTHHQAKRIYWRDLKSMVPKEFLAGRPSESELTIPIINGSQILVMGMDKPERIEGAKVHWIFLDEFANMRSTAWEAHIRPTLSDTLGNAWFYGVPEGRNHYYDLYLKGQADTSGQWEVYQWGSGSVLPAEEVDAAKRDLDPLIFDQEYNASFVNFTGAAYYNWSRDIHVDPTVKYTTGNSIVGDVAALMFCFDFNVSPGVAVICQEDRGQTLILDEVWIPRGSTTEAVCDVLLQRYASHPGIVTVYGDATGGSRGTAKVAGSDWDIIQAKLSPAFGSRLRKDVPAANPTERARVNAVNQRLKNAANESHIRVSPKCIQTIKDFEGVRVKEGGSGELDKRHDVKRTHLTDAVGYMVARKYPIVRSSNVGSPID